MTFPLKAKFLNSSSNVSAFCRIDVLQWKRHRKPLPWKCAGSSRLRGTITRKPDDANSLGHETDLRLSLSQFLLRIVSHPSQRVLDFDNSQSRLEQRIEVERDAVDPLLHHRATTSSYDRFPMEIIRASSATTRSVVASSGLISAIESSGISCTSWPKFLMASRSWIRSTPGRPR